MTLDITPIPLKNYLGSVNCYLIKIEAGFILIDTGWANKRKYLGSELEKMGCSPGKLKLIILTHGDFDHTGNCAYISKKFGAKIAMHRYDLGMVEKGDMFWNRKKANKITRTIINTLLRIGGLKPEKFKPDLNIEEGSDLSDNGFNAKVFYLPGHSKGSVGILTDDKNFFCGDLLENTKEPALGSIIDDPAMFNESIKKLESLHIDTVYPGHGKPFAMQLFIKNYTRSSEKGKEKNLLE